ncbi:MAG: NAD(P) transhydrogenase subunit alpha [Gemmatimonadota bacterium]
MKIGVPRESASGEQRASLVPDGVARLAKLGFEVVVEPGAGVAAGIPDSAFAAAGAVAGDPFTCEFVVKVQMPSLPEVARLRGGQTLIALFNSTNASAVVEALASRGVTALALERVPRITRAQSMDVLSSQATIAGYKAVLVGASRSARLMPMLTTAAGNIPPARALVLGAGVAGLMAIATARRLGAQVSGFDIRAAAREQVLSLGATFVGPEPAGDAETAGGYAREQTAEERARTMEVMATHLRDQDLVIATALIPGRPAPRLITAAMVQTMKPGAVIVDMAADNGGNCELCRAGETVFAGGVEIIGATNLPATVPFHASQMFSKNVVTLLAHMTHEAVLRVDRDDEIVGPMCLTSPVAVAT